MIPPGTSIGTVRLRVADIDALSEFYERVIGLRGVERDGDLARLGPEGGEPLVELLSAALARRRRPELSTGLFHMAILRARPRRAVARLAAASDPEHGWRLTGASDHLVERGALPRRPRGQRHRDLPRPPARRVGPRRQWRAQDGHAPPRPRRRDGRREARATRSAERRARRHRHGPRAPPGGGHPRRRGASTTARSGLDATARSDPARPVRRGGRRPPSHRAQHLAEPGRAGAAGGIARPRPLRARPARRGRAGRRRGDAWARPATRRTRTTACSPPTRPGTTCSSPHQAPRLAGRGCERAQRPIGPARRSSA